MSDPNYERPNEKWICGWTCEGRACRIGPSPRGKCRATSECAPALETKPGETKGRWRCTRPKSAGGPCSEGPLPDGACSHAIPPCQPVRSLRAKRGLVGLWTTAVTVGVLLVFLCSSLRGKFLNPAPLSTAHALLAATNNCAACHDAENIGVHGLVRAALFAQALPARPEMDRVDQACLRCHIGHDFHNARAPYKYSCSACHEEHSGPGRMPPPADANCAHCHGDAALMKVAFTTFVNHPNFHPPADSDTLKFNHQKHLTGDIPLLNGHKLTCTDCHKPDATGAYMRPITYEANCQSCHALQFDVNNPELHLPHGNATAARAFLRSLPTQYADFGRRARGITEQRALEEFVGQQMAAIRLQSRTGEDLEREAFFNTIRTGPDGRPRYAGCAYCHEVRAMGDAVPAITAPAIPNRWLMQGRFDHSKHQTVACATCHDATHSRDTADVLLPAKQSCVECHGPKGKAASSCATCHGYHNTAVKAGDFAGTLRTADASLGK